MSAAEILSKTDPFRQLPSIQLQRLCDSYRQVRYPCGAKIIEQGQPIRQVGIMLTGLAKIAVFAHAGNELVCGHLEPGNLTFDAAAISGQMATANVISIEDSILLIQSIEAFLEALESHPALKRYFYQKATLSIQHGTRFSVARKVSRFGPRPSALLSRALSARRSNTSIKITTGRLRWAWWPERLP